MAFIFPLSSTNQRYKESQMVLSRNKSSGKSGKEKPSKFIWLKNNIFTILIFFYLHVLCEHIIIYISWYSQRNPEQSSGQAGGWKKKRTLSWIDHETVLRSVSVSNCLKFFRKTKNEQLEKLIWVQRWLRIVKQLHP